MRIVPGVLATILIALAARSLAGQLGAPAAVIALVMGLAVAATGVAILRDGFEFAAKPVLRLAVGLLGAQVSIAQLSELGLATFSATAAVTLATFVSGVWIGRRFGLSNTFATIAAASVAICGASAALAISAVLPNERGKDQCALAVVAGVNILSTIAMAFYPAIGAALGLDPAWIGVFLGMSIHDVAQVAAAALDVSPDAAASAATVKLARVLLLAPIVVFVGLSSRGLPLETSRPSLPLAPWFLWLFVGLVAARSTGLLSANLIQASATTSSFLLVGAVGAIGALVAPRDLLRTSPRLIAQLILLTLLIALISAAASVQLQHFQAR